MGYRGETHLECEPVISQRHLEKAAQRSGRNAVSNLHRSSTLSAGVILNNLPWIKDVLRPIVRSEDLAAAKQVFNSILTGEQDERHQNDTIGHFRESNEKGRQA